MPALVVLSASIALAATTGLGWWAVETFRDGDPVSQVVAAALWVALAAAMVAGTVWITRHTGQRPRPDDEPDDRHWYP